MEVPNHITVTTYTDWPYSGYENSSGVLRGTGIAFRFLNLLMARFNFTYDLIIPELDKIGDEKEGVMSVVAQNKADVAVAFIPKIQEFENYCNFSSVLDVEEMMFFMKRPRASARGSGLFAPYSTDCWIGFLVSMVAVGTSVWLINKIRSTFTTDTATSKYTFPECMWFAWTAYAKQSTLPSPRGNSTRIVFGMYWLAIVIFTAYYIGEQTGVYTFAKFELPVKSMADIYDDGYYWYAEEGRTLDTLMRYNREESAMFQKSYQDRYGKFIDFKTPPRQILNKIDKNQIYFTELIKIFALAEYDYKGKNDKKEFLRPIEHCPYIVGPQKLLYTDRAFVFPRNSKIFKPFNRMLDIYAQTGLITHYKLQYVPNAHICPANLKMIERPLQIGDMETMFKFLALTDIAGAVALVLEWIVYLSIKFYNSKYYKPIMKGPLIRGTGAEVETSNMFLDSPKDDPYYRPRSPPPKYEARDKVIKSKAIDNQSNEPPRGPSDYLFQYLH